MGIIDKLAVSISASSINVPSADGNTVFHNVINLVYFLAGTVAVIVIIIAGFSFTVSGSNPSAIAKARNAILYSVIGLVVVLSAFVITQYVIGRF